MNFYDNISKSAKNKEPNFIDVLIFMINYNIKAKPIYPKNARQWRIIPCNRASRGSLIFPRLKQPSRPPKNNKLANPEIQNNNKNPRFNG
jgi:hypothetical protein